MMSSFLPFLIFLCMLCKTVVAQVQVSAENSNSANGTAVKLTCSIKNFTLPSSWINDTSSGILSTCVAAGVCSVTTSGRYSYSATASTIVVQIQSYDAASDNFGWKCRHDNYTDVFKFTNSTTRSTPSDLPQWWCTCGWCIGLVVASSGLLVLSVFVGIIIFCKKRKDIENQICSQISTISIAVLVVIIIAVTGVLAGIVCLCSKEKKYESQS